MACGAAGAITGGWAGRDGEGVIAAGLDEKMLLHSGIGEDAQPSMSVAAPRLSASVGMDDWRRTPRGFFSGLMVVESGMADFLWQLRSVNRCRCTPLFGADRPYYLPLKLRGLCLSGKIGLCLPLTNKHLRCPPGQMGNSAPGG